MLFRVRYHPEVKSTDIPRLGSAIRERIRRAIESRLTVEPHKYGMPLRKNLKGYWKLEFSKNGSSAESVGDAICRSGAAPRSRPKADLPLARQIAPRAALLQQDGGPAEIGAEIDQPLSARK